MAASNPVAGGRAWAAALLLALALVLLPACSVTVGAPQPTPGGPGAGPTNTPIEQIHLEVTPVPSPTPRPPTLTPVPGAPPPGATTKYTIQAGDTLSGIAQEFGIAVDDLVKLNNIADPNQIQAGQVLIVPAKGAPPAAPSPTPTRIP